MSASGSSKSGAFCPTLSISRPKRARELVRISAYRVVRCDGSHTRARHLRRRHRAEQRTSMRQAIKILAHIRFSCALVYATREAQGSDYNSRSIPEASRTCFTHALRPERRVVQGARSAIWPVQTSEASNARPRCSGRNPNGEPRSGRIAGLQCVCRERYDGALCALHCMPKQGSRLREICRADAWMNRVPVQ